MSRRAGSTAYIALAAVCFFWGTTYLAIRIAIETLPPAFVIFTRFTLSGSILLAVARMRGAHIPRGRELWIACGSGVMILGGGQRRRRIRRANHTERTGGVVYNTVALLDDRH